MLPVHQRLIHWLEERGELNRALEYLPSDAEIAKRRANKLGLTSPEFSVLVAYAKLALKADLTPTALADDPWFQQTLTEYFPPQIQDEYATPLAAHPLRQEIVINAVVNSMVNRGGITFAFRAGEETGADPEQVARAFVVCREVFGLTSYVAEIEALDNVVSTQTQTILYLEFRRLLDRASRWFLSTRPTNIDVVAEVERFRAAVAEFAPRVGEVLQGSERRRLEKRIKELEKLGVPAATATRAASLLDLFSLLDVVDLAEELELPVEEVAAVYYYASEKFTIDQMLTLVSKLPRDDRWDALARGAMRDDLYAVLESLTRSVLVASDGGDTPAKRFEYWADANRDALKRARTALHGVERLDNAGLAALSVALRTLRSVLRAGQPA
jgi:glutamate dehydrogenase